ncbi:MAG TPA: glycosyltransferase family 2 protein [Catalimonadaceae bacterium]|jgi:glycosyltransferase involved in cell wall biosynthesis|nr:glycosyltransferase family 2 protein [Catalimonadaceae bacterium]
MRQPEITIITPVFNGSKYIETCLQNVIDQKCESVEHLVMDGASTDGTHELVSKWAAKFPHITLISEKDKGQSDAMNKGIAKAKGKIISFLNVDDYYEPGVFNRVLEIFSHLPEPSFVCGNLNILNPDGSLKHFNRPDHISLVELLSNCFEWPYNPSAYFYHKSLHEIAGGYNEENHLSMDYEFILSAARNIQLRHIDETWGNFQNLEDSKTNVAHAQNPQDSFQKAEELRAKIIPYLNKAQKAELKEILARHIPHGSQLKSKTSLVRKLKTRIKNILGSN